MKFAPVSFAMCAPPGFDEFTAGIGMVVVIGILAVVGLVGYFCVRDAYRFGRSGMSWMVGLLTPAIFSGVGYFAAGPIGTIAGAPLLVAFGLGRRSAHPDKKD
jgi:hypothetical protein